MNYQTEEFENWASKLLELEPSCDPVENSKCLTQVNQIIDHLNAFNYEARFVNVKIGEEILNHCTQIIDVTNDHLVTKFCSLIVHFLRKQNVVVDQQIAVSLCSYLLKILRSCAAWTNSDCLLALSTLLYSNGNHVQSLWEMMLGDEGIIIGFADSSNKNCEVEVRYHAVKCIEYLTVKNASGLNLPLELTQKCFNIFLNNLFVKPVNQAEGVLHCKLRISCCIGLQNIIFECKTSCVLSLGEVLATLKAHMFYGLPNQMQNFQATCLYPSPLSQSYFSQEVSKNNATSNTASPNAKTGVHGSRSKKRRSAGKKVVSSEQYTKNTSKDEELLTDDLSPSQRVIRAYPILKISSSESEFSDSEGGNVARLRSTQTRVRYCALAALSNLMKALERKILFGFWSSFLPDGPTSFGTLTTCLLKDPSPKVRCGALMVLGCMLDGSAAFLSLADEHDKTKMAFTTLSSTVTSTIKELHRTLILALVAETSTLVLTQIIKCITLLVQNAPVAKLNEGFLTKLSKQLRPFLSHKESNVKVAALTSFGAILCVKQKSAEILEILRLNTPSVPTQVQPSASNDDKVVSCWLLDVCLEYVSENEHLVPLPVRLESLQLLSIIVKDYFMIARYYLDSIRRVIENGLANKDVAIKLHNSKLLEELGRVMSQTLELDEKSNLNLSIDEVVSIWSSLMNTSLPSVLQITIDELNFNKLAIHGCNCLSTIGKDAFSCLKTRQQIFCQTVLIGLSSSENKNVKAAAIRSLGVIILYPCLKEDGSFLLDVLEKIVTAIDDSSLEVRLKTAWALGNLTDVLVLNKDQPSDYLLNTESLKLLFTASITASKDIDRVASNGVRALGNLLKFLGRHHLENERLVDVIKQAIETLMTCASTSSNMKILMVLKNREISQISDTDNDMIFSIRNTQVRWNSCYAFKNMFTNSHLNLKRAPWRRDIFHLLSDLAKSCKNFKVRISAVNALEVPQCKEDYGNAEDIMHVWNSVVEGLDNAQGSSNFVEYQQIDHLSDKTCSLLCHLLSLIDVEDLKIIFKNMTDQVLNSLVCYFERYYSRQGLHKTLDEVLNNLRKAENKLDMLKQMDDDVKTQNCIVKLMKVIKIE